MERPRSQYENGCRGYRKRMSASTKTYAVSMAVRLRVTLYFGIFYLS